MNNKKIKLFVLFFLLSPAASSLAETNNMPKHPFYVGAIGGFGSTTWKGLVPIKENQNVALMLSTPTEVEEGGVVSGVLAGYEFSNFFAIEANYIQYAEAKIHFDSMSIYSFFHNGSESLSSKTQTVSVMGKIMAPIPHSRARIFSSVGVAGVYRKDIIVDDWRPGPSFGLGINYNFTERIMGEIAGNFTVGYGESQLSPVDSYYPFLYSVAFHLIYRV